MDWTDIVRPSHFQQYAFLDCQYLSKWIFGSKQIWTDFIVPESVQNFQIVFKNDIISVQTLILIGRFEYCQLGFRARYDTVR